MQTDPAQRIQLSSPPCKSILIQHHHPLRSPLCRIDTPHTHSPIIMHAAAALALIGSLAGVAQAFEITFPNNNGGYWVVSAVHRDGE